MGLFLLMSRSCQRWSALPIWPSFRAFTRPYPRVGISMPAHDTYTLRLIK